MVVERLLSGSRDDLLVVVGIDGVAGPVFKGVAHASAGCSFRAATWSDSSKKLHVAKKRCRCAHYNSGTEAMQLDSPQSCHNCSNPHICAHLSA